ncbi:MAG: AsnC family transcriptional regulator [Pseudomonadota bacterium]
MNRVALDDLDRALVRASQAGLPLTARPYHALAEQLGVAPEEVMARFQAMLAAGVVRRIGAVPNHYALGYRANGMTVWNVADDRVDELGERVGRLPFVSHCYRRPRAGGRWPYNLFAMVHGHDRAEVIGYAAEIGRILGRACRSNDILYSRRILKKTGLRLGD